MSISTPNDFVTIPLTTSADDLADAAIATLQAQWPNWQPNEANLEVALIEIISAMAAQVAQVAANMPAAALIQLATQLLGLSYSAGAAAQTVATFTMSDAGGYTLSAGQGVYLGGIEFDLLEDVVIPMGETEGTGTLVASDVGSYANGQTASGWASINMPAGLIGLTLATPTDGGADAMSTEDFLNYVAQYLQLRARSIITLLDMEIEALQVLTADIGGGRVVATASGSHPRNITVTITDASGEPPSSGEIANVQAALSAPNTRMVNAVITVQVANYCVVGATYTALALPNVDPTTLESLINSALSIALSPGTWAAPTGGDIAGQTWINQPVVHLNKMIAIAGTTTGTDYIESFMLTSAGVEKLSSALTTSGPITSLPMVATTTGDVPAGSVITIVDPTGVHTQTWTTTADAPIGSTHFTVTSQTPNYAYPTTSLLTVPVSGDLIMPGVAPLPQPGTFNGTVVTPSS